MQLSASSQVTQGALLRGPLRRVAKLRAATQSGMHHSPQDAQNCRLPRNNPGEYPDLVSFPAGAPRPYPGASSPTGQTPPRRRSAPACAASARTQRRPRCGRRTPARRRVSRGARLCATRARGGRPPPSAARQRLRRASRQTVRVGCGVRIRWFRLFDCSCLECLKHIYFTEVVRGCFCGCEPR